MAVPRIILLLALGVLAVSLAACQEEENPLLGTWRLNTAHLPAETLARMQNAAPDAPENILTLEFGADYLLIGREALPDEDTAGGTAHDGPRGLVARRWEDQNDPRADTTTRESDAESASALPDYGRRIPAQYRVAPAEPGKRRVVFVTAAGRAERQVTIYAAGGTEFIVWPVSGQERRYER